MNRSGQVQNFNRFPILADLLEHEFYHAPRIHTERWQSVDISKMPHMAMRELLHYSFSLDLPMKDLDFYRTTIQPSLPWADDHFLQERVSREPLNPGETYKYWNPGMQAGGNNASTHLRDGQQFDHSYAERYWPKYAGFSEGGKLGITAAEFWDVQANHGIRFEYGDLDDLVDVLSKEPLTRQAYLPVWFPEDLAAAKRHKRVPCSLGYHFLMRNGELDVIYSIRSCDYIRHFRDDVYLTIRLLLWILEQCELAAPEVDWASVQPGRLRMHIGSFHMFEADWKRKYKDSVQRIEESGK